MSHEVEDFERDVIERSRTVPVLVDFWAPWCGPCKTLGPILERLATEAAGRWELVKVNTEEQQDLATAFDISSIPALKLFREGGIVAESVGLKPEAELRRWIEEQLPSPATAALEKAAALIDDGQLGAARALLEQALAEDPQRAAAKLLLAEILLTDRPEAAVELLDGIAVDSDEAVHAQALRAVAIAVQRTADSLPEDGVKEVLLNGLAAIRRRDWDAAMGSLVEVTERRRHYAEDLAANTGKAIFRYLGIRHPVAEKHYRRFSSALNA